MAPQACGSPSRFDRLEKALGESRLGYLLGYHVLGYLPGYVPGYLLGYHVLGVPGQYESVALMLLAIKWISIVVPLGTVFTNPVTY